MHTMHTYSLYFFRESLKYIVKVGYYAFDNSDNTLQTCASEFMHSLLTSLP